MQISTDALMEHAAAVAALHGVDPSRLSGDEAARWVAALARVRTSAEAVMAVLGQRIDEVSSAEAGRDRFARAKGFAGAPTLLSQAGQMSTGEANRLLSLGRAMADADAGLSVGLTVGGASPRQPEVLYEAISTAVAEGRLASGKADIIRKLLEALSEPTIQLELSLVALGARVSVRELQGRCDRELARDHDALVARERRQRAQRYVSFYRDADGMVGIAGKLDPVTAAPIVSWIDGQVRALLSGEREVDDDQRRSEGQIRADLLAEMAHHALGCESGATGTKTVMVVQVSKEELEAGRGTAVCHGLAGPISVDALRQIAIDAAVLPVVMGGGSLPLDLGRSRRLFTPAQRVAIALRDGGCAKCGAPVSRCDVHHIRFWSDDGSTDITNGLLLCVGCHHRLHDFGWGVEIVAGEVWFIPPATADPERRRQPACSTRSAV